MSVRTLLIAAGVSVLSVGLVRLAEADTVILGPGSVWEYTSTVPVMADWNNVLNASIPGTEFDWVTGFSPFGNYPSDGPRIPMIRSVTSTTRHIGRRTSRMEMTSGFEPDSI